LEIYRMLVTITDLDQGSADPEQQVLAAHGISLDRAQARSQDEVIAACQDADALLVQYAPVDARVLDALPSVRVVGRYGVGYDMIDVPAATERGVLVITVPDYCTDEVADHTLALLLACARHLVPSHLQVAGGGWNASEVMPGVKRLADQTLGIVGLGRIGRAVARRARGFGLRVLAHDPQVDDVTMRVHGAQPIGFEALLRESDYVSLHAPLSAATRHLIGPDQLALMKPTAYLLNTARGGLVDQAALQSALQKGQIAGAALDVLEHEPPAINDALRRMNNVILTAHAAFYSDAAFLRLKTEVTTQIAVALNGELPRTPLNPEAWAGGRRRGG
jgi:D-3-phosphoglycerate dehydrogenase / 2-oxoglutarate reductase